MKSFLLYTLMLTFGLSSNIYADSITRVEFKNNSSKLIECTIYYGKSRQSLQSMTKGVGPKKTVSYRAIGVPPAAYVKGVCIVDNKPHIAVYNYCKTTNAPIEIIWDGSNVTLHGCTKAKHGPNRARGRK